MSVSHLLPPTTAEVSAIATLADPVVRNLRITQCYHELAVVMSALTGPGANWCAVATWASRQAGQSIRKEDLERGAGGPDRQLRGRSTGGSRAGC